MKKIQAFDNGGETADRYTVILPNSDTYLMSMDANMPNGVCIYVGKSFGMEGKQLQLGDLSKGVLVQIITLLVTFSCDRGKR